MTQDKATFSDEILTAYLDGELDASATQDVDAALADNPDLADRLAALDLPMDSLRAIMAPDVLSAPAMPVALLAANDPAPVRAARPRHFAPLSLVAAFLVGMVATTLIQPPEAPVPTAAPLGWTAAVATYQSLYVTETLEASDQDPATTDAVLARAAEEFDVVLAPATEITGMDFKNARILGFRGKPLLQMAYLRNDGTPFALCLIRTDNPDRDIKTIEMFDLAGVSWVKDGVGYLLIGGDDTQQVEDLSTVVRAQL